MKDMLQQLLFKSGIKVDLSFGIEYSYTTAEKVFNSSIPPSRHTARTPAFQDVRALAF